jgi:CelD/BcsL family acetyltransferase involved in cellulose biosynthesis
MPVSLKTGEEAIAHIGSTDFITAWKALCDGCAWSTACQHPDFIIPWYQLYAERGLPVIVFEQGEDGQVSGFLPLALIDKGKTLVGAGMVEAEYQCWLALPENGNRFITEAIAAIRQTFPGAALHLRYINGGAPLDWIRASKHTTFCRLQSHPRPLLKLPASEIVDRLNNKKYRAKLNKLKKSGEISFQRIEDHQGFVSIFEDMCRKYDARQAEKNFVSPFRDDALKAKFYIELHRRGILHATILHVGNEIAAFHAGLVSRNWLHLGINAQADCFEQQSPGRIHLLMLSAFAQQENFSTIDLTPGGDKYKERFATQHDMVHELLLFPGFFSFMLGQAKFHGMNFTKSLCKSLNIRPARIRQMIGRSGNGANGAAPSADQD